MIHAVGHQTLNQPTLILSTSHMHFAHTAIVACSARDTSRHCCVIHRSIIERRRSKAAAAVGSLIVSSCLSGTGSPTVKTRDDRLAAPRPTLLVLHHPPHSHTPTVRQRLRLRLLLLHERAQRHLTCLLGPSAILRVRQTADSHTLRRSTHAALARSPATPAPASTCCPSAALHNPNLLLLPLSSSAQNTRPAAVPTFAHSLSFPG